MWNKLKVNPVGKFVSIMRVIITFLLVDFCWIFFRSNNISDAGIAISKIFTNWEFSMEYFNASIETLGLSWKYFIYIVFGIASLPLIEKLKYIQIHPSKIFNPSGIRYATYFITTVAIICAWIYLQASNVGSSFIYFQF